MLDHSKNLVILIHGWGNNGESAFFPQLKVDLESKGYSVLSPNLPNPSEQTLQDSYEVVEEIINKNLNCNISLIGHSSGGYLACKLAENYAFDKVVLVAPASPHKSWEERRISDVKNWLNGYTLEKYLDYHSQDISFESIQRNIKDMHVFFGLKDPYILESNRKYFIDRLKGGAKIALLEEYGHMGDSEGIKGLGIVEELF